jgi:aspartate aminotransferase
VALGRAGIRDTVELSERLLEQARVAVVPGEAFGTQEHIRISFATSMEQLERGLIRLHQFIADLSA